MIPGMKMIDLAGMCFFFFSLIYSSPLLFLPHLKGLLDWGEGRRVCVSGICVCVLTLFNPFLYLPFTNPPFHHLCFEF